LLVVTALVALLHPALNWLHDLSAQATCLTKINSKASEVGSLFHETEEMNYTAAPEMMAKHPDFDSLILSLTMDDGFSVNYRHRQ
jgi:hypothetical protein